VLRFFRAAAFAALVAAAGGPADGRAGNAISGAAVWNDRGIESFRSGDYRTAITCFETALRLQPEDPTLRFNLSSSHARIGLELARTPMTRVTYLQAVAEAEKAIELLDGHPFFYSVLGFIHQEMGDHDEAYRAFGRAAELDPSDGGARVLLGNAAYERDDLEEALEAWRSALEVDPELGEVRGRIEKADRERELEEGYRQLEGVHFRIRYDREYPDAEALVREMRRALDDARRETGAVLPRRGLGPVSVVVYSPDEFRRLTAGCDWTGGLFDGKIRVPFPESGRADGAFRALVTHEYVHALLYEWTSGRCPAWLNEGLAQALAGEWDSSREETARGLASRAAYPPLSELEDSFLQLPEERVEAAYLVSYLVAAHLLEECSTPQLQALLRRIGSGATTEEALRAVLRTSSADLLEEALESRGRRVARAPGR